MKTRSVILIAIIVFGLGGAVVWYSIPANATPIQALKDQPSEVWLANYTPNQALNGEPSEVRLANHAPDQEAPVLPPIESSLKNNSEPLPNFMVSSLQWLSQAQAPNGGYGAGLHSAQNIRDPHAVKTDPATTALVGLAYIRSGNTHRTGQYAQQVEGILKYLLAHVEGLPSNAKTFTQGGGTQPQYKLGSNIDATFTSQFLTRMLEFTVDQSTLNNRIKGAISVCVSVIEAQQNDDGSMQGGTWAGVLQSSMANSALEQADNNGVKVNKKKLRASRSYQRGNYDAKSGTVTTGDAAGISLYAISSSNRASAMNARRAQETIEIAKEKGVLSDTATVSADNLRKAGLKDEDASEWTQDYQTNESTIDQLQQDDVLSGFGNNGGEEFISYMMTSESLVITGGEAWEKWNDKMMERLAKIQNPDGSWSGHHCITSPVFCTAAVVMTLATDRDVEYLAQINDPE